MPSGAENTSLLGARRRRTDRHPGRLAAAFVRRLLRSLDPVTGGRFLLAFSGVGAAIGAALLGASANDWLRLTVVYLVMALLVGLSLFVDLTRLPRSAAAAYPITMFAGLATLGVLAPHLTAALTGLLTGGYLYTGLTQRRGSSLWVVPIGSAALVIMNGGLTHAVLVRMLLGALMSTTIVETLAAFTNQQRRLRRELTRAANYDALTGIPNRRDLEAELTCVRAGDAIVLCDLDHFKVLNDSKGHDVGDRTLADFATLLRAELRANDYCARYGGEEFMLVLPRTSLSAAEHIVRRLHAAWEGTEAVTTFSAGIALCRPGRSTADTIMAADIALYQAKAGGRNTTCVESTGAGEPTLLDPLAS